MRKMIFVCLYCFLLVCISFAGEWASSIGSCYEKRNKNVSGGLCLLHTGYFLSFDYGFHDAISGGIATGFIGYRHSEKWRYNYMPMVVRAAFHPFNIKAWADRIIARYKIDVFIGVSSGWRVGWVNYRGASQDKPPEPEIGGFFIREYIGIRFFPTDMFYILAEEGSGLGLLNIGVGLKF